MAKEAKTPEELDLEHRHNELTEYVELTKGAAATLQETMLSLADVVSDLRFMNAPRTPPDTRNLDERMVAVQRELEDVPRAGHAEVTMSSGGTYSYDYITEADLMKAIRPLLAKHGIATYYSDELLDLTNGLARVKVTVTFAAAGQERICTGTGIGTDKGDKGANKAKTSAVRYILWKTFLQPSDEDPELENVSAADAAGAHQAREQAAAPRARAGAKTPEQRKAGLIERITKLSIELDEVQGRPIGTSMHDLADAVRDSQGHELADCDEAYIVKVGTALGTHVATARELHEKGDGNAGEAFDVAAATGPEWKQPPPPA